MADGDPTFTGQQAADAQNALRQAIGLPPEQFPVPAFVGMISDEIEQWRRAGRTDEEISAVIARATGITVPVEALARFYAEPEERGRFGSEHDVA